MLAGRLRPVDRPAHIPSLPGTPFQRGSVLWFFGRLQPAAASSVDSQTTTPARTHAAWKRPHHKRPATPCAKTKLRSGGTRLGSVPASHGFRSDSHRTPTRSRQPRPRWGPALRAHGAVVAWARRATRTLTDARGATPSGAGEARVPFAQRAYSLVKEHIVRRNRSSAGCRASNRSEFPCRGIRLSGDSPALHQNWSCPVCPFRISTAAKSIRGSARNRVRPLSSFWRIRLITRCDTITSSPFRRHSSSS